MGYFEDYKANYASEDVTKAINLEWVLKLLEKSKTWNSALATTSTAGLMSATDKRRYNKLNIITNFFDIGDINITTAQFLQVLYNNGAFDDPICIIQCGWWFAGNPQIIDAKINGFDEKVEIAGSLIEIFTIGKPDNPPIDSIAGAYKIRITTPPVSSVGHDSRVYMYFNHGKEYTPKWKRLTDGSSDDEMDTTPGRLGMLKPNGSYTFASNAVINVPTPALP